MDSSRNIVLALLVIAIGLAIFYMIDPTMGGMIGHKYESFEDVIEKKNQVGTKPTFETGAADAAETAKHGSGGIRGGVNTAPVVAPSEPNGVSSDKTTEGFMDLSPSPMPFPEADKPGNCYPKNQLAPQELLPGDPNSKWAQVNPMGQGDISGKNFLNAGAMIGVNTVGQSLRNANQQLRSEPPCPQVQVSIWNQTTIEPDLQRKPLEGF